MEGPILEPDYPGNPVPLCPNDANAMGGGSKHPIHLGPQKLVKTSPEFPLLLDQKERLGPAFGRE